MAKRIFISFNYTERGWRNDLLALFQAYGGPVQATPVYVSDDVAAQGDAAVKAEIKRCMDGCKGLLVVVGNDAHNSPWIDYELNLANGWKIPKAAIRHPAASGGLPNHHKTMTVAPWNPMAIARLVEE